MLALKTLDIPFPSADQVKQFFNEYDILKGLEISGGRQILERSDSNAQPPYLLMEFVEGLTLKAGIEKQLFSFPEQLKVAIRLAGILAGIHQHKIIHKDVNPRNIIINPDTLDVRLIDFEFATQLDLKTHHLGNPERIEGTLAYISPEQTGRMNRVVDYRSDLYSLGVCYYELFSGQLPFASGDPMELVYNHLARSPKPPHQLTDGLPEILSDIILKLLAKNAEDRYQSAFGLEADLQQCLQLLEEIGTTPSFPLAKPGFSDRFQIPQKLYGREAELDTLMQAYRSISQGNFLLLLVAGYSGVGKSSLVYEVHKPLTENRGFFIEGKFDQYQRDIPYSAWIQAFNQFVDLLLTENPVQLEAWKKRLLVALNEEGKVLTEVLPRLEKIIGPQPVLPELENKENKTRFNRVIKKFIQCIAQARHPLFIFIDDWQWADVGSIELLEKLSREKDNSHLIITGAYRDNEVPPTHPFAAFLNRCRKDTVSLHEISLDNLYPEDISRLLADTLNRAAAECQNLTEIFYEKTQGNAFFLQQMLHTLHEKKALSFEVTARGVKWSWDIAEIRRLKIADNVVELMIEKVRQLPAGTQQILKIAACIGTLFKRELLSIIHEDTEENIQKALYPALLEGFVIPIGTNLTFAHDRIQQAVYSLLPEAEKKVMHYRIGKLLWKNALATPDNEQLLQEQLFDIVNQLTGGKDSIRGTTEKKEVAALCLRAGQKARSASAHDTAVRFFQNGKALLDEQTWQTDYDLMMSLHFHHADCELTLRRFEQAKNALDRLLDYAVRPLDRARILERIGAYYNWLNQFAQSVKIMERGLQTCGMEIPRSAKDLQIAIQQEKRSVDQLLHHQSPSSLLNLPPMADELQLIKMNTLSSLAMTHKQLGHEAAFQFYLLKAIHLSLLEGSNKAIANIYSLFCSVLAMEHRYSEAFQFANLALKMVEKNPHLYKSAHTLTRAALWGLPYGKHLKEAIPIYEWGFHLSQQDEYFMFANIKIDILFHKIAMGTPLDELLPEIEDAIQIGEDSQFMMFYDIGHLEKDLILHLKGEPAENSLLTSDAASEKLYFPDIPFFQGFFSHNELQFYCWFPEYPAPPEFLAESKVYHQPMVSNIKWADYDFYAVIFLVLRFPELIAEQAAPYWQEVQDAKEKLRLRTEACPDNFRHKYHLVEAELARLSGRPLDAMKHYRQAAEAAGRYGFTHIHALTHELFARFFLEREDQHSAAGHLLEAKRLYQNWGALAKVRQLEEKYPTAFGRSTSIAAHSSGSSSTSQSLDYLSLLKASQALSGEIVLSNLLEKMMPILLESAGAEKGTVIEWNEGQPRTIARATAEGGVELSEENSGGIPLSVIHYVFRTQEPVVLAEAVQSERFSQDSYIQARRPRSILCFPIKRKEQVTAIFYFENNLAAGAFTEERLEVLNSLSAQISISLENARLYQRVEAALARQVQLTDAYSKFVPREFLKHLGHESILDVRLGDQVQGRMSVLFADIRSYSTLSEQMTPAENFNFINAYLKRVGPIIAEHGGFVGQYYGDGFMAIFMQDPASAVRAAVDIQNNIHLYNQARLAKQRLPVRVGIGVHSGPLMMGIIGDEKRMDTGIISDTVNTASRLEGLTKFFNAKIIISEASFAFLSEPPGMETRFLGKVAVKGKQEVLPVYEVFNPDSDDTDRKKAASKAGFEAGLARYFEKDFVNATLQLKEVAQQFPEDTVTHQYLRRAASYLVEGVPEEWTGVVTMEGK